VITFPLLAIVTYFLVLFAAVAIATALGDYPFHQSTVLSEAQKFMVEEDPAFRLQEHDATIRWVGGRNGAWEIYFTHRITRERRCVRWINCGFLYGYTFEQIKCSPTGLEPSG
jgi:hypothetical protein